VARLHLPLLPDSPLALAIPFLFTFSSLGCPHHLYSNWLPLGGAFSGVLIGPWLHCPGPYALLILPSLLAVYTCSFLTVSAYSFLSPISSLLIHLGPLTVFLRLALVLFDLWGVGFWVIVEGCGVWSWGGQHPVAWALV